MADLYFWIPHYNTSLIKAGISVLFNYVFSTYLYPYNVKDTKWIFLNKIEVSFSFILLIKKLIIVPGYFYGTES